jgi:5'-3' exonuclease
MTDVDWLLIDGPSWIFRAYYGVRSNERAGDGQRVGAVQGFLNRLARLIDERRPRQLVVADDWAWRPKWRVQLIETYKAHRVADPMPAPLAPQVLIIRELLDALGIDIVGAEEHEAEDVIATLCALAPGKIEIVSGDRDLFALVEDPRIRVLYPEKGGLVAIDEAEVTRRYGIPGRRYADFAILRGDPSDGLPGLKGVGSVTAAAMIRRHGDIPGVLRDRPLRDADRAYLVSALKVVPPVADLPMALPGGRRDSYPVDEARLRSLAARYGVKESCDRLLTAVGKLAPERAGSGSREAQALG